MDLSEVIINFENAAEAFERTSQGVDIKRKGYLGFYSRVCRSLAEALKGTLPEKEIAALEEEKARLVELRLEKDLITLNERCFIGNQVFRGKVVEIGGYVSEGKRWVNQRIIGLARMIEGPRFMFFLDVLLIKELCRKNKS